MVLLFLNIVKTRLPLPGCTPDDITNVNSYPKATYRQHVIVLQFMKY